MLRKDPFVTEEYYHVYNRGIDKRVIFKSDKDYRRFIMLLYVSNSNSEPPLRLDNLINHSHKTFWEIMALDKRKPLVSVGAWCLMANHFHLILRQEVNGGITKFMRKLSVGYAMYFNIKYQRQGALFGGLFKSVLIDANDRYLKHLFAYINLNPLDIKFPDWENKIKIKKFSSEIKNFLEQYQYSSYLDFLGKERVEAGVLSLADFPNYFEGADSFRQFIDNYLVDIS